MTYNKIDPKINNWINKFDLKLLKEYKDYDVRTVEIVDKKGNKYQIWIDPPNKNEEVGIHAWDYKHKRIDRKTSIDTLEKSLDTIYGDVIKWTKSAR